MVRFYTPNLNEACDALDLYDIDYDLDDGDRLLSGPYSSEEECWNAMLKNAKRELRIDTEENGYECEFETVPECGRITLTNHVNGHSNVTNWYTIEIPDNAKDNT